MPTLRRVRCGEAAALTSIQLGRLSAPARFRYAELLARARAAEAFAASARDAATAEVAGTRAVMAWSRVEDFVDRLPSRVGVV